MMKIAMMILVTLGAAQTMAGTCPEGQVSYFSEQSADGNHQLKVARTCHNGSYYDLSNYNYNPSTKCVEGRREIFTVQDDNGHNRFVTRTCVNGRYYPKAAAINYAAIHCTEGAYTRGSALIRGEEFNTLEKCVGGKYRIVSTSRGRNH